MSQIEDKIKLLKQEVHWTEPVLLTEEIFNDLGEPSVRSLAETINMSKTWVDNTLLLARSLRVWPELKDQKTRNLAFNFVMKKRRRERLIKK